MTSCHSFFFFHWFRSNLDRWNFLFCSSFIVDRHNSIDVSHLPSIVVTWNYCYSRPFEKREREKELIVYVYRYIGDQQLLSSTIYLSERHFQSILSFFSATKTKTNQRYRLQIYSSMMIKFFIYLLIFLFNSSLIYSTPISSGNSFPLVPSSIDRCCFQIHLILTMARLVMIWVVELKMVEVRRIHDTKKSSSRSFSVQIPIYGKLRLGLNACKS